MKFEASGFCASCYRSIVREREVWRIFNCVDCGRVAIACTTCERIAKQHHHECSSRCANCNFNREDASELGADEEDATDKDAFLDCSIADVCDAAGGEGGDVADGPGYVATKPAGNVAVSADASNNGRHRTSDLGPRPLVELGTSSGKRRPLRHGVRYIYRDTLWQKEPAGCVVCAEASETAEDFERHGTLRSMEDGAHVVCLVHGPLDAVPFVIRRDYLIKLGDGLEHRGAQDVSDHLFIPSSLNEEERRDLFKRLIGAAAKAEEEENLGAEDE